jgi:hypothetical protein
MKQVYLLLLAFFYTTISLAQPANNDCASATTLTVGTNSCAAATIGTTVAATASSQSAYIPYAADDDVWYKFTTPAGGANGTVKVNIEVAVVNFTAGNQQIHLERRDGASFICDNYYPNSTTLNATGGTWALTGLNPSTSYSIRLYTDDNTSRLNFTICAFTPPTPVAPGNDDCANATTINLTNNTGQVTQSAGTIGATASTQASGDGSGKDDDVWFQFTTPASPAFGAAVTLSDIVYDMGFGNPVLELWGPCNDVSSLSFHPYANSFNSSTSLTPSTTYRVRVYTYGTSSRFNSFKISVALVPANDNYSGAVDMVLNSASTCVTAITGGSTYGATEESGYPSCGGATVHKEVWYKFTATKPTAFIQLTNITQVTGSSTTMVLDVFQGSNTGTFKLCSNTGILDFDGSTAGATLIPGTVYYMRVYNQDANSSCSFNICNRVPVSPSFNSCANAVNIAISTDEYCNNSVRLSTVNTGLSTFTAPPCASTVYNDVWLKFVAPTPLPPTSLRVFIKNFELVTGSNPNLRYAIYSGTCNALSYLSCDALPSLTPGNTYYIRIFSTSGAGTGNFDVCIAPLPATQTNTTCASAVTVVPSADQSAGFISGSTLGLTTLNTITDCFNTTGSPNKVLWYKFVAAASSHMVEFTDMVQLSTNANALGYRVTTGTCPTTTALSPAVCVFGVSNQNTVISSLTIGQTYFIEVMENTFNGGPVSFKMRVIGTAIPSNDEAAGATNMLQNPTCSTQNGSFKFSSLSSFPPATLGATAYYQDVWYKFQAVATTATIRLAGRLAVPRIAVYNAAGTSVVDAGAEAYTYTATGLTVGQTYAIRILNTSATSFYNPSADFTICVSGTPSSVLATGPTPSNCIENDNSVVSTNSGTWLHFTKSGNLIASVLDVPGGAGMGVMTAKYYINSGAVRADGTGVEYMDRNFQIVPSIQPTNPVRVRMYFSAAEFNALVGANDGDGNDIYWLNDLKVSKFSSLVCQSVIGSTGEALYGIAGYGSFGTEFYIDVIVPNFSGFYLKNVGVGTPLPVGCNSFNYRLTDGQVQLIWQTANEVNNSHFELQRSTDGLNYTTISTIMAQVGTGDKQYRFVDAGIRNEQIYFYRLKQIDKDGKSSLICRTLQVKATGKAPQFGVVYPNPTKEVLMLDILTATSGRTDVQIVNRLGQIVKQEQFNLQLSTMQLRINTAGIVAGTYSIRIVTKAGVFTQSFSKL